MEDYLIYIAFGILGVGLLLGVRDLLVVKLSTIEIGYVTRVKNKTKKSRRYCYPYVDLVVSNGNESNIRCYSAKKSGHDKYLVGDEIEFYVYNIFNRIKVRCKIGFFKQSIGMIAAGVFAIILVLIQN